MPAIQCLYQSGADGQRYGQDGPLKSNVVENIHILDFIRKIRKERKGKLTIYFRTSCTCFQKDTGPNLLFS